MRRMTFLQILAPKTDMLPDERCCIKYYWCSTHWYHRWDTGPHNIREGALYCGRPSPPSEWEPFMSWWLTRGWDGTKELIITTKKQILVGRDNGDSSQRRIYWETMLSTRSSTKTYYPSIIALLPWSWNFHASRGEITKATPFGEIGRKLRHSCSNYSSAWGASRETIVGKIIEHHSFWELITNIPSDLPQYVEQKKQWLIPVIISGNIHPFVLDGLANLVML